MKKQLLSFLFWLLFITFTNAQNVGIGVPVPAEKLDVNGNINVSGTIKANGIAGQNGQALMTNSVGNMVWANLSEYKNFVTFTSGSSSTWVVPAGITKIYAEVWGGGGGGSGTGGGGGGGYISGVLAVTPGGNVTYTVGLGGAGGSPNAGDGAASNVSFSPNTISALGGFGSTYSTFGYIAQGGSYSGANGTAFIGQVGEAGGANSFGYHQSNATTFLESQAGGKGGDGGNSQNTGGKGTYQLRNSVTFATIYVLYNSPGKVPGGGGGGNITWGGQVRDGAAGMVIIHY